LAAEGAAAVARIAAVGIGDDLAAGEPGVALRAADRERARAVDDVGRAVVDERADRRSDHAFDDVVPQARVRRAGVVLRSDDDLVDAGRTATLVLDRHLRLAVGTEVGELPALARRGEGACDAVRERDR